MPKVRRLLSGRVRTQSQDAMFHVVLEPIHGAGRRSVSHSRQQSLPWCPFLPSLLRLLPITKVSDATVRARALKSQLQESQGSLSSLLPALSQGPRTPGLVEAAQGAFVR